MIERSGLLVTAGQSRTMLARFLKEAAGLILLSGTHPAILQHRWTKDGSKGKRSGGLEYKDKWFKRREEV